MKNSDKLRLRLRLGLSAVLVLISIFTLLLSTRALTGVPERVGIAVVSFFQRGFSSVGQFVSRSVTSIAELRRLEQSYNELLARTEELRLIERDFARIQNENRVLREQLGFSSDYSYSNVPARIIGKDPGNIYTSFTINKGMQDGIRKNNIVVAYQEGIEGLVGRVIEVSRSSALVLPVYDASAFIAVRLQQSRYEGLAVGQGSDDQNMLVRYVAKRARPEISPGDILITSGMQSLYPPGIVVGRVQKIHDYSYLTSLELEIDSVIDFAKLEYVFVIIDPANLADQGGNR